MKRPLTLCLAGCAILVLSSLALAILDLRFFITPADLAGGAEFLNGQGGLKFGYDPSPDSEISAGEIAIGAAIPKGVLIPGPNGFGDSCFWSDVQGSKTYYLTPHRHYTSLRLSPKDIFGRDNVTVGELKKIKYWTKNNDPTKIDWRITIYTESTNPAYWYHHRIHFTRPVYNDTEWNQSGTDTNLYLSEINNKYNGQKITLTGSFHFDPLGNDQLGKDQIGSTINIDGIVIENILFIDIAASYATDSPPCDSYLDGIEIELQNGDHAVLDLGLYEMRPFYIEKAKIDFKKKPDDDKISIKGIFTLDQDSDGKNIGDTVTVKIGPFIQSLSMVEKGKKWEFKRDKGETGIKNMTIEWKGNKGEFDIHIDKLEDLVWSNPVEITLQIGNDGGLAEIDMTIHKDKWEYDVKK